MTTAQCPYCGKVNKGGLMEEVRPGEPTPMMELCEHHVFEVFTELPWDYLSQELHRELNQLPLVTECGRDIEAIVRKHLVLEGSMAFAKSDHERELARQEVVRFLGAKGYNV